MPSPASQEEGTESAASETTPSASQASSRSIYSFWGNGAGPSQPPPPPAPAVAAKRKRKKAEDGPPQARIMLSGAGGSAWGLGRGEDAAPPDAAGARGKGRGRVKEGGGEEDELKEMARKTSKPAAPRARAGRKGPGPTPHTASQGAPRETSSSIGPGSPPASSSTSSPRKQPLKPRISPSKRKKTSRPRQSAASLPSTLSSPEVIQILSSDPPPPHSPSEAKTATFLHPLRRLHTPLSRTLSSSSKGAADDPIDVEEAPVKPGPKKLVFAADTKPAHSFFTKLAAGDSTSSTSSLTTQIVDVTSTPSSPRPIATALPAARDDKVHSFFGFRPNGGVPGKEKQGWGGGVKEGEEWSAPWPGRVLPSHEPVAGPSNYQSSLRRRPLPSKRPKPEIEGADFWYSCLNTPGRQASQARQADQPAVRGTPPFIASHPAMESVRHRDITSNRETWAERYRPVKAEQVLGNETEALYLKDWLQELSVGATGGEKRDIHRKVKRYKSQLFDGWIVDDAGLFGDPTEPAGDEDKVEYIEYEEPYLPLGQRPLDYPSLATGQLTNAMILTGPHGSGKSAAVYAAAAELGWEVFEVHPGMGKRTAASLMSWVGDVGKNHLVVKGGKADKPAEPTKNAMKSFFGNRATKGKGDGGEDDIIALPSSQGSRTDPILIEQSPRKEDRLALETNGTEQRVRQSLILIDEADVLFAEENTFWPAVIALIAESRRPVVLTCNDLRAIPLDSIPLQAILHFQPPPSHLAIPYLESIAARQHIMSPEYGSKLYHECTYRPPAVLDQPLPPNGHEPLPYFDLRRALMQLQLDRDLPNPTWDPSGHPPKSSDGGLGDLKDGFRSVDSLSWAESMVSPGSWSVMGVNEVDRYEPSGDDELGVHLLLKPDVHDLFPVLPGYDASACMAEAIIDIAGRPVPSTERDLQTDQIHYVRSLLPLLDPLIPLSAPLLPTSTLFTLYVPVLQDMVEWEDAQEAAEEEAVARGEGRINRKTGRPKRATVGGGQGYGRYLDSIDPDGLQAARDSRLRW